MNQLALAQVMGGDGPSAFAPAVMMIAIFAIFYFLVIRPQQTKERQKDEFRSRLKKGDEVLAAGGLYGRVVDIKGPVISVEVAANVRVRVDRKTIEPLATRPPKAEEKESSGA
jgi:preprotein translocase subunit YajC